MKIKVSTIRRIIREEYDLLKKQLVEGKIIGKYDIGSGRMGNGLTIWNRNREVHGNYEKLAHVQTETGVISWVNKNLPAEVKNYIKQLAKEEKSEYNREDARYN